MHGEEEGGVRADTEWLVDPLDGTANFVHGFDAVGVSVGLVQDGRPVVGVVHAPFLVGATEPPAARTGPPPVGGAFRDGMPISVSERAPEQAIVATGFPFRRKQLLPEYLATFEAAIHRFEDLRRVGAASLDLCWTADGAFDGYFELRLGPWDVAAGALVDPRSRRHRHRLGGRPRRVARQRQHPRGAAGDPHRLVGAQFRRHSAPYTVSALVEPGSREG